MKTKTPNMESKRLFGLLVAVFAIAVIFTGSVSALAFADIQSVEVSGVEGLSGDNIAAFAGQTLPVRVIFEALSDAEDVRVKSWIAGESDLAISSDRFDIVAGNIYTKLLAVRIPEAIDPSENFELIISLENRADGIGDQETVSIAGQRTSYTLEILDVVVDSTATSGDRVAFDVVLKNRGRQLAEDTFVKVSIPALGIETRTFVGDLSPEDQDDPVERDDSVSRRLYLSIPSTVASGLYDVEIQAYNSDTITTVTKRIFVGGAVEDTLVVTPSTSKTFAVGEVGKYSLTIVNTGDRARVYDLAFETSSGLTLDVESPVIVVPAGASETVKINAIASQNDEYAFTVKIMSDSELVKQVDFTSNVEGTKATGNATILLTVILAIVFVVLLIVLIALLTRKPEKAEEFGESYY